MFHLTQQATSEIWRYLRDKLRFTKEEGLCSKILPYIQIFDVISEVYCVFTKEEAVVWKYCPVFEF